jgi:sporulation protein YunB
MLSPRFRRRRTRFFRSFAVLPRGQRAALALIALGLLALITGSAILTRAKPIVAILAKAEARDFVLRAVNGVIEDEAENGSLDYERLVTLDKDDAGNVTALVTNMALINTLQARISSNVAKNVLNVVDADLSIPLGNVFGGMLFPGRGPNIPVRIQSVTDVSSRFVNEFSAEGINQTRHKIMLEIAVDIDILVPGGHTKAAVTTQVAIAETIIVGAVPNVYAKAD